MRQSILRTTLCILATASAMAQAAVVPGQGTWSTTLKERDLDGNLSTVEAYYDTLLGITWLANVNLANDHSMTWTEAMDWAGNLEINGIAGWRLPDTHPIDGVAYNYANLTSGASDYGWNMSAPGTPYAGSTGSELAHMFYYTLGNKGYPLTGWGLSNTGPFQNLDGVAGRYIWSATEYTRPGYASPYQYAWIFYTYTGFQHEATKNFTATGWAVHDGDVGVSAVPVPAAVWLFASGLIAVWGAVKRKTR